MKQRLSSLDVKVLAHELNTTLVSLRLANLYDLSSRCFLLRFAKPDHRAQLLVDSGFRAHLTQFSRTTAAAPSPFISRLRKFLRTRRCTAVRQIGTDRVLEIEFGEGMYRLFIEFYAGGNILLTDGELNILALLRSVNEGPANEQYRVGLPYQLSRRQNYNGVPPLTKERIQAGLKEAVAKQEAEAKKSGAGKKGRKATADRLRKALAVTTHEFPPILLEHALFVTGFDRQAQPEDVLGNGDLLDKLMVSLGEAGKVIKDIFDAEIVQGYIIAKRRKKSEGDKGQENTGEQADNDAQEDLLYDDFHPFKPAHLLSDPNVSFVEFDGFNKTADEFFSSLEGQRLETRLQEREDTARRKIDAVRQEQAKRIDGLQQVQELNVRKAQAIEANVERVEEAVSAVNGLIAQGMDWADIGRLIANEQARGNPVALSIQLPLKLHENTVTLLLAESTAGEPEEELVDETDSEPSDSEDEARSQPKPKEADKRLAIDIDLAASAWSNARQFYDNRRSAAEKEEKTAQASQKALKSTEQKVMADLKKGLKQEKELLRPVRKQFWFEKFIYFISSDGYLVLAGKDAQQNEMLYRRYLRKGDIYIHADLHGAASVIIKNNPATPEAPIPPSTLGQAGHLAVCTSSAWDSKAVMSAWWVNADQVSKTAPTGEYLTTGGFMVRGKKNFLPPAQLLLGFGVLFQISEESKARHVKHRLRDGGDPATSDPVNGRITSDGPMSGDADDGSELEDDDFPDAAPGPGTNDTEFDEDDDFPDAAPRARLVDTDGDDDDFDDVQPTHDRETDDEEAGPRLNPLQSYGERDATQHGGVLKDARTDEDNEATTDGHDSPDDGDEIDETSEITEATATTSTGDSTQAKSESAPEPKAAQRVRGKKGKAKKAAAKYADQDEEDRALAMKLLGSRTADERREVAAAEKAAKTETVEAARARRRAQHEKQQKQGLEAEEIRRLNLEEGIEDLGDEDAAHTMPLDALVGNPLPGDEILEAIPICAPWSALAKYKYKVKIQPGQQKKGKALREILGKWVKDGSDSKKVDASSQDVEKVWPREAELLRAWKDTEVVGVVPVKTVRVTISGGGDKGGGAGRSGGKGKGGGRGGKGSKRK